MLLHVGLHFVNGRTNLDLPDPLPREVHDVADLYQGESALRGDVEGGRRRPVLASAEESSPLGEGGNPLGDTKMEDFRIYIPFTSEERTKAGDPGKAAPRPRKG